MNFETSSPGRYAVRDFVYFFIGEHGFSPSLEEIGAALGLASVSTVHKHVRSLEREGLIELAEGRYRNIRVPNGKIACPKCRHKFRRCEAVREERKENNAEQSHSTP